MASKTIPQRMGSPKRSATRRRRTRRLLDGNILFSYCRAGFDRDSSTRLGYTERVNLGREL
jgi:hypothetical protein